MAAFRGFLLTGLVVIVVAAAIVPLPLRAVAPGDLVAVDDALSLRLDGLAGDQSVPGPVAGAYLGARQRDAVPLTAALRALVDSGMDVRSRTGPVEGGIDHPLTRAALYGLGMSPYRGREVAVAVAAEPLVDTRSLAAALHAFDGMADLDVAAGRRILALGYVGAEEELICPERIVSSVAAAAAAAVDLVVVPTGCAEQAKVAVPAGTRLPIRAAGSLLEAVTVVSAPRR